MKEARRRKKEEGRRPFDYEPGRRKEKTMPNALFSQCPVCPIPNALFAQFPVCPMPNAQCPGATKLLSW
ncbi:MAG: hypothetical protein ACMG55_16760 [Microcoleus sp.]